MPPFEFTNWNSIAEIRNLYFLDSGNETPADFTPKWEIGWIDRSSFL